MAKGQSPRLPVSGTAWSKINRDQAADRSRRATERSVEELIEAGIALSATAAEVREAISAGRTT